MSHISGWKHSDKRARITDSNIAVESESEHAIATKYETNPKQESAILFDSNIALSESDYTTATKSSNESRS